eukprot:tig00020604_g11864.t1
MDRKGKRAASDAALSEGTGGHADYEESALLGLPDALLVRIIRQAGASEESRGDEPFCCDELEAKHRTVVASSAALTSGSAGSGAAPTEPWVDLWRVCRLRRVCRRFDELVQTGGVAPRARLEFSFKQLPTLPGENIQIEPGCDAALDRQCEGAARVSGIEELDVTIAPLTMEMYMPAIGPGGLVRPSSRTTQVKISPVFSLAPLARFRSLRALRLGPASDESCESCAWGPQHLWPLGYLPRLSCLDLKNGYRGLEISPGALVALSSLGVRLTALRATLRFNPADASSQLSVHPFSANAENGLYFIAAAFPGLERLRLNLESRVDFDGRHIRSRQVQGPADVIGPLTPLTSLRSLSLNTRGGRRGDAPARHLLPDGPPMCAMAL